jgi:hypothetical protein
MSDYAAFLARKRRTVASQGIDTHRVRLPAKLFDWQAALVRWALRKGRCALFADTGLGKSAMQLAWAAALDVPTLILAPLCVAEQTVAEGLKFGIVAKYVRDGDEARRSEHYGGLAPIFITNYERLEKFDPSVFGAVVLDECFAGDTPVDTPFGPIPIKDLRKSDTILNAYGEDTVRAVIGREITTAVVVTVCGRCVVCSANHPWLCRAGWRRAIHLRAGDEIVATTTAMRMVRSDVRGPICSGSEDALLREILLREMADAPTTTLGQGSHRRDTRQDWPQSVGVAPDDSKGARADAAICSDQADDIAWDEREGLSHLATYRTSPQVDWREGAWVDHATATAVGRAGAVVGGGTSGRCAPAPTGAAVMLLPRPRESDAEDRDRSRWLNPLCDIGQGSGRTEGSLSSFVRVDGVEILEPGDPRLDRWRESDGRIRFYDIEAARHPSFSVHGCLVHNSSILKAFDSATRTALIHAFAHTPYRLCCTATPSPNDITELANHAEFLGLMTRPEFLATWFIRVGEGHRTTTHHGWRMKKHAVDPFYRWLASWAVAIRSPKDLGYDDTAFRLPPLRIVPEILPSTAGNNGSLFPELSTKGIQGRLAARRTSLTDRVAAVSRLTRGRDQWLLWCGLNEESDALADALPDAVAVSGDDSYAEKVGAVKAFVAGEARILVSKIRILGYGLNLQHCHKMAFVGISDSWEQYYQGIRRCWRYGQRHPVDVHIVVSEAEQQVVENVRRKEAAAVDLSARLLEHLSVFEREEVGVA